MTDNKKGRPGDWRDRDRISGELGSTMLVEAAAGTGKTTNMMSRMANLVSSGSARVENIAAVTFTRKAAAELRDRFRVELEKRVAEASGRERELLSQALEHIERCYIGTIHSFCARLLRERPIEAGVGISFREIEDDEDNELKRKAWDEFMSTLFTSPDKLADELLARGIYPETLFDTFEIITEYPDVDAWPVGATPKPDFAPARQPIMDYWRRVDELLSLLLGTDFGRDALMPALFAVHRAITHTDFKDDIQFAALLSRFESVPTVVQKNWPRKQLALDEKQAWANISENFAAPLVTQWREYCYPPVIKAVMRAVDIYKALKEESGGLNFQDLLMKAAASGVAIVTPRTAISGPARLSTAIPRNVAARAFITGAPFLAALSSHCRPTLLDGATTHFSSISRSRHTPISSVINLFISSLLLQIDAFTLLTSYFGNYIKRV
jgi:ATP-dependent helicase/nuclease subunit A